MISTDPREHVLFFKQEAQSASQDWHDQIQRWRNLYDFKHYHKRPKPGETQFADPTPTNTVDLAVGVMLASGLDWKARGWTPTPREENDTSRIEKYLTGLMALANRREGYSITYESLLHLVRDGCAVQYSCWDRTIAERVLSYDQAEPGRKVYLESPVLWQVIDPLALHLIPGGRGRWAKVLRCEQLTPYDVEMRYGRTLSKHASLTREQRMTARFDFIDFWEIVPVPTFGGKSGATWNAWYKTRPHALRHCLLYDDEFIKPLQYMPGYDELPYTIGFFKPVDRKTPQNWGHGIIRPMESSVEAMERAFNRRQRAVDMYTAMPLVVKTLDGRSKTFDPALGQVVTLSPSEDIGFPKWSGEPPEVDKQLEFVKMRTQQAGFPDSMYGQGASQSAGYAISQLNDMSRIRLTQPTVHAQLMFGDHAKKILSMTRNFGGDALVRVYGKLRGRDFVEQVDGAVVDGYEVEAVLKPIYPNEETRNAALAVQASAFMSQSTLLSRYFRVEQPDDEMRRRLIEQIQQHPMMQQFAVVAALQEMADDFDDPKMAQAALTTLQLMQQGGQGQPGRPEEPQRMPQFLGTPSPRGMPTSQEAGGEPAGQSAGDQLAGMVNSAPSLGGGY